MKQDQASFEKGEAPLTMIGSSLFEINESKELVQEELDEKDPDQISISRTLATLPSYLGQHDPGSIANLIQTMKDTSANIVIGSRFLEGNYKMGFMRRIGKWMYSNIAKLYTGQTFTDPTSGYQLLDFQVASYLAKEDTYPLDYPDVNIIMLLHKKHFKVVECSVHMLPNTRKSSMHRGYRPIIYFLRKSTVFLSISPTKIAIEP